MEKKKNTGLIILVVILSLLVVGLGGYIAYDKVLSKNDEKESGNTGTDKKEEIKDDTITLKDAEVVSKFETFFDNYGLSLIDSYEEKITDFNNLKNQDKLLLATNYFNIIGNTDAKIISTNFNISYFNRIFDKDLEFTNEDTKCCNWTGTSHCHVKYYSDGNYYSSNPEVGGHGAGNSFIHTYYNELINFEKMNKKIILTYIKLFHRGDEGGYPQTVLYSKYNINEKEDTPFLDLSDKLNDVTDVDSYMNNKISEKLDSLDNYDDLPKYKYTIEVKEDGSIVLDSYEFVK